VNCPGSRHARRDIELTTKIVEIHDESGQTYGCPRVHYELQDQRQRCSRKRVALHGVFGAFGAAVRHWPRPPTGISSATCRGPTPGRPSATHRT